MKKQTALRFFFLTAVCLFCSSCLFQTSSTTVNGRVTEYGEVPVANAEVRFGGALSETLVKTKSDGTFTVTARHRPTQMLYLKVSKSGFAGYEDKFPGFAAPEKTIEIELMKTIMPTK